MLWLRFFDDLLASESEEGEIEDLTEFEDAEIADDEYTEEEAEQEFQRLQDQPIKLAIIGRPNVGKSTLTNRILGEERVVVYDMPGTTRDSIYIPMERDGREYVLIDTAGVRRRGRINETVEKFSVVKTLKAVEDANVVLLVIDARENISDQDLSLLGFALNAGRSIVLAVNKWDGLDNDVKESVKKSWTAVWALSILPVFILSLHCTALVLATCLSRFRKRISLLRLVSVLQC